MFLTVVSFVLVMSVIVFVHELGHFLVAKRNGIIVDEFGFGYPPRLLKIGEKDGTEYTINWIPFGGFTRMRGEDDPTERGSFAAASKWARASTLLAGAGMNFLLGIILFAILIMATGVPDTSRPGAEITGVVPDSPAEQAGLLVGDRIVAADSVQIVTLEDLQQYTNAHLGEPVTFEVERPSADGSETAVQLTATARTEYPSDQGPLGVMIGEAVRPAKIWEAAWGGVQTTWDIIALTVSIPATLIREGKPISDAGFLGPVGIAVTTGDVVRSAVTVNSALPVIRFMALLSVALGFTNLLPIPALDGGRLLFVLFEAIRRKRVAPAQEGLVHLLGFGLLLVLVGIVTVREITSLVMGTFPTMIAH